MKVNISIFISVVIAIQLIGYCPIAYAQRGNGTAGELPSNQLSQLLSILINGTVHLLGNCTTDQNASQVRYLIYTRQNPSGYRMTSFKNLTYSKGLHILLFGWGGTKDVDYIKVIRNAYMKRYDTNIITVDFSCYVGGDYISAYCNLPAVANNLARFLCRLNNYYALKTLHIVGHSLGAQLAGITSYKVKEQCQLTIGRITGLDPASPGYQDIALPDRLDASDADFVDVIHTNQGQYGYIGSLGDIDFYPNCGFLQPGCLAVLNNITLNNITNLPLNYIQCNHQRSCYYFAESILLNDFLASPTLSPLLCVPLTEDPTDRVYMGEYCRSNQKSPYYYVKTNSVSPYGLGPDGPLN